MSDVVIPLEYQAYRTFKFHEYRYPYLRMREWEWEFLYLDGVPLFLVAL